MSTNIEVRIEALKCALKYNETRAQVKGFYKWPSEVMNIANMFYDYLMTGKVPETPEQRDENSGSN